MEFWHSIGSFQRGSITVVQILLKLPVVFAEIRPPKPKKIKSKSCTFSVRHSAFGFGSVSVSAHM